MDITDSLAKIEEYQSPAIFVHTIQYCEIICTSNQNEQTTEEDLF